MFKVIFTTTTTTTTAAAAAAASTSRSPAPTSAPCSHSCVLLIVLLSGVPAIDEELVTETSLSLLPEEILKKTDMLPSSGKMNGAVDGDRNGRCVHVFDCVHTCCIFLGGA